MMLRQRSENETGIREGVWRSGLGKDVCGDGLAVELAKHAKHKMTSGASLVHNVNTQVDMLGALAAADPAFRPGNARLVVGET